MVEAVTYVYDAEDKILGIDDVPLALNVTGTGGIGLHGCPLGPTGLKSKAQAKACFPQGIGSFIPVKWGIYGTQFMKSTQKRQ